MITPGEFFKKISSASGNVMDAAKEKIAGLRQPATPPVEGIGGATTKALGEASVRPSAPAAPATPTIADTIRQASGVQGSAGTFEVPNSEIGRTIQQNAAQQPTNPHANVRAAAVVPPAPTPNAPNAPNASTVNMTDPWYKRAASGMGDEIRAGAGRAEEAGAKAVEAVKGATKGLGNSAVRIGKAINPAARWANTIESTSAALDPTNDLTLRDRGVELARGAARGIGMAAGGALGGAAGGAITAPTIVGVPGGLAAGGALGTAAGFEVGDAVANWAFGPQRAPGLVSRGVDFVQRNLDKTPKQIWDGTTTTPELKTAKAVPAKPTGPNSTPMSGTIGVPGAYQDLFSNGTGGFAGPIAPNVAAQLRASAARVAGPKQYMDPKAVSGTPGYTTGTQPLPLDENGLPPSGPFEQAAARRAMYGPGNLAVPAQGTGAFKRSSDGGVVTPKFSKPGEPTNVGSEVDQLARQGAAGIPGYGRGGNSSDSPLGGLARVTTQDYEARRAGRYADAQSLKNQEMSLKNQEMSLKNQEMSLKGQTAATAATTAATAAERQRQMDIRANKADDRAGRAADQTYEAAGKKELQDRVAADIEASTPAANDSLVSGAGTARKNQVDQKVKTVMDRMESSAAQRKDGKKLGQLSPAEREQLVMGNKMLEKTVAARDTWTQSMRDFFGNKRVDTKNIYSAMPQRADRDIGGGIRITMGNGNTATVEALEGGGFRIFGVNNPVDADMAALLKKPIDDLLAREMADQQKRKK